jgi:hypothetical protein
LFIKKYDNVLLICLAKTDVDKVLVGLHDGPIGGIFGGETIGHKNIRAGYFWPTLFRDAYSYARKCKLCQMSSRKEKKHDFPLQPIEVESPFE